MILNIALGILLAVFALPLVLVIINIVPYLFRFIGAIFGIFLILALVAIFFVGEAENLKTVGWVLFFVFYCLTIGYLTKGFPLLEKLSDGVDCLSFRSGDWINFFKERVRNHARRGFILGFLTSVIYVANSANENPHILNIFLPVTLVVFIVRVVRIEIMLDVLPSKIDETDSRLESATNLKEKALILVKEKKFDLLVMDLRNALDKKLIPKVGDPPGEMEIKRYLAGDLDLFIKKGEMDHWSRFDICVGFDRSAFPELCVSIDVHVGVIGVQHFHYSLEFQEKMNRLSSFLNTVKEQDRLKQLELEAKLKIKLAEEESKKFKGI